ncbi:hypothetical protein LEN26_018263 [Aphanomyces euteiches]|nr:hypothetical protein LEN26_018263 [Aphanomyces euteiches]
MSEALSVPGLRNLGNTCFFNAVLQALATSQHFQEYVSALVASDEGSNRPFSAALHACLDELLPKPKSRIASVVPRDLNLILSEDASMFRGMRQQDAEEGFQLIMEKLDKEVHQSARDEWSLSSLLDSSKSSTSQPSQLNPFYGLTGNMLECSQCGMKKPMWTDTFLDLKLSLCPSMDSQRPFRHLYESLQHYISKEHIEGVECTHCTLVKLHETIVEQISALQAAAPESDVVMPSLIDPSVAEVHHRDDGLGYRGELRDNLIKRLKSSTGVCDVDFDDPACWTSDELRTWYSNTQNISPQYVPRVYATFVRHVVLARPPRVLAFHINRNVYVHDSIVKLDVHLAFDQVLVLRPPFLRHCETLAYHLLAVVVHHGNERGGHYTCYRRIHSSWVHVSDEAVVSVSLSEVLRAKAYLLLYEQQHENTLQQRQETTLNPRVIS